MTELCARYAVSRKTGYKWLARYDGGGRPALRRPQSGAASLSAQDRGRGRAAAADGPSPAPRLGTGEAAAMARAAPSGRRVAGDQHRRRSARAPRPREEAPAPTPAASPRRRAPGHHGAQRPLGHGLQRPVPDGRSDLLLPAHGHRSAHALLAGVPRAALDEGHGRAADLRSPLPRVRPAAGDADRQRRALRVDLAARPHAAQRVVAPPGHSAPAHPARRTRNRTAPTSACTRP